MNTLIIARRKGVKVRVFDTQRAKMGPWVPDPQAERERTMLRMLAAQGQQRDAFVAGYVEDMLKLKRDKLVDIAAHRGVKHPSKANKAQIATLLAEASYAAQVTL